MQYKFSFFGVQCVQFGRNEIIVSSLHYCKIKPLFILGWRCYGLCKPRKTNWTRAFVPPGAKTFEDYKERRSSYSEDFEPLLSSNGIV